MRSSTQRTAQAVLPATGGQPDVFVAGDVVIDTKQTPFALVALAFLNVAAGAVLLMHAVSGLATGLGGGERYAALAVGAIEVIVGVMLLIGARWAYHVTRVLIPANFVASLVLFALGPATSLLLVAALFGFATFVLFGPGRFATASRIRMQAWAGARTRVVRPTAQARAEHVDEREVAA